MLIGENLAAPPALAGGVPAAARRRWCTPVIGVRPRAGGRGRARLALPPRAIGFGLDGSTGGEHRLERRAESALRDAASLLVLQSALRGDVCAAFRKVLGHLKSNRDDGISALGSFSDFFAALAASGAAGFTDVVLDNLLSGEGSAFAEAAARGEPLSKAQRAGAAADLDTLQRLTISEATLARWTAEAAAVPDAWLAAASAFQDTQRSSEAVRQAAADVVEVVVQAEGGGGLLSSPVTDAERAEWRRRIGGRWRWSEGGVEDLIFYYRRAGAGAVAASSALAWANGRLTPAARAAADPPARLLSVTAPQRAALTENTHRLLAGPPGAAQHALLHGPAGAGKSTLVAAALAAAIAVGLRTVALPKAELRNIGALGAELARHPRARFVVLVEDLAVLPFQDSYTELVNVLGSSAWPPNAVLYATAPRADGLRPGSENEAAMAAAGAAVRGRFGLRLAVPALSEADFLRCVRELQQQSAAAAPVDPSADDAVAQSLAAAAAAVSDGADAAAEAAALAWARRGGEQLVVRAAAHYAAGAASGSGAESDVAP